MSETKRPTSPRELARILYRPRKLLHEAFDALPAGPMVRGLADDARSWLIKKAVDELLRYDAVCRELTTLNRIVHVPKAKAKKSINQFVSGAKRLRQFINSMPIGAIQSITSQTDVTSLAMLRLSLDRVLAGADKAVPPESFKKGASLASDISQHAGLHFEFFTGRKAAPGRDRISGKPNAFETFLTAVFNALNVKANAQFEAAKLRSSQKSKQKQT